ncbi:lysozyme, partial [Lysobacter sp. D1-1-M9]|uniref:lysozyme n=1 Tax=Novilysobacter longmucuonensis TaxID=3098603 RepID=UPI002FC92FFD
AVLAATVAFVAPWEGGVERGVAKPYRDIVGVWTVCYGDTAVPMREYTSAECEQMLGTRLGRDLDQLGECITGPVSTHQMAAILSLAYNAGVPSICRSTLVRQLNAGQPPQVWCQQFDRWVFAGGRKVRGLVNRRAAEKELCLK